MPPQNLKAGLPGWLITLVVSVAASVASSWVTSERMAQSVLAVQVERVDKLEQWKEVGERFTEKDGEYILRIIDAHSAIPCHADICTRVTRLETWVEHLDSRADRVDSIVETLRKRSGLQ